MDKAPSSADERATRLDPSLDRAWFSLGKALALLGRGKEADAAFEKSFELSPVRKLMALAAEHQKEGRLEEAERIYRRVLRDNPKNVDALRSLALLAAEADKPDDAEALLLRAIGIAPDFHLALLDLGRLRKEQDRFVEALECFDRAIALEPRHPQAHYLRAGALARASFTQEAIESYRRCLVASGKMLLTDRRKCRSEEEHDEPEKQERIVRSSAAAIPESQ